MKNKQMFADYGLNAAIHRKKWWHALLHNQTAIILRFFLTIKKDIVIATLPYHLKGNNMSIKAEIFPRKSIGVE